MLEPSNNITAYLRTYVIVTLTEKDHEIFFMFGTKINHKFKQKRKNLF